MAELILLLVRTAFIIAVIVLAVKIIEENDKTRLR